MKALKMTTIILLLHPDKTIKAYSLFMNEINCKLFGLRFSVF